MTRDCANSSSTLKSLSQTRASSIREFVQASTTFHTSAPTSSSTESTSVEPTSVKPTISTAPSASSTSITIPAVPQSTLLSIQAQPDLSSPTSTSAVQSDVFNAGSAGSSPTSSSSTIVPSAGNASQYVRFTLHIHLRALTQSPSQALSDADQQTPRRRRDHLPRPAHPPPSLRRSSHPPPRPLPNLRLAQAPLRRWTKVTLVRNISLRRLWPRLARLCNGPIQPCWVPIEIERAHGHGCERAELRRR